MAEHALQRVVQLVRDARDELPERRQLLRLHEPVAQLRALRLELGLRRHVARDKDDADRLALFSDERRQRHDEGASQLSGPRPRPRRSSGSDPRVDRVVGPRRDHRAAQSAGRRPDDIGDRPIDELLARHADALEERHVHGDEQAVLVGDGHEIGERVERVLELAAGAQHRVEQQDIFNRGGELPSHLVGALEQVDLRARLDAAPPPSPACRARAGVLSTERSPSPSACRPDVVPVAAISARSRRSATAAGARASDVGMRRSCAR